MNLFDISYPEFRLAKKFYSEITDKNIKLGDIKKLGKEIKRDHDLAMELWSTGDVHARILSTLIFDKKLLTETYINQLASDLLSHTADERTQIADWLLANQLMKDRKLIALMQMWEHTPRLYCSVCFGTIRLACAGWEMHFLRTAKTY